MQIEFKSASVISAALHAGVLLFALLTFSGATLEATPPESMPIDLVSADDFSKLAKGVKDAPKAEKPKPLVEKKAEIPKPVEEQKPKPVEKKPEVHAAKEPAPTPPPEPEKKPDPIAEKIKDQPKPAEKPPEKKVELPPRKPTPPKPKPQPKFDANQIAALLDKRDVTREASAGETLSNTPSLGASKGEAAQLSQSEIDALRARLRQCWNPPVGAVDGNNIWVTLNVAFKRDGSLAREPVMIKGSPQGPVLQESAKRALYQCQPYTMLRPEHYETWREIEMKFDPHEMFGG
jgi:colicin import membrane protein